MINNGSAVQESVDWAVPVASSFLVSSVASYPQHGPATSPASSGMVARGKTNCITEDPTLLAFVWVVNEIDWQKPIITPPIFQEPLSNERK